MEKIYALEIKWTNFQLLTFLNGGEAVDDEVLVRRGYKKKKWFIFRIDEQGKCIASDITTFRDMSEHYDIMSNPEPMMLRLKRYHGEKIKEKK